MYEHSEETCRIILDSIDDAIFVLDPEAGALLDCNEAAARQFRRSVEDMRGMTLDELNAGYKHYNTELSLELVRKVASGQPQVFEWKGYDIQGQLVVREMTLKAITLQGKCRVIAISRDTTERKQAEETTARLASIAEGTTDLAAIADLDGHLLYMNKAGRYLLGIGADEDISNLTIADAHPEWAMNLVFNEGLPTAERDGSWSGETALLTRNGREIPVSQVIISHRGSDGEVDFFATIMRDITERKRAEQALKLTQFTVDHAGDAIYWVDSDAHFEYVNHSASRYLGYSREELLSMSVFDIDTTLTLDTWRSHWQEIRRRGSVTIERTHIAKDGRTYPVEIAANYLEFQDKQLSCAFVRDITERKRAEEALKASEANYREIFDAVDDAMFVHDTDTGQILDVNQRATEMYGYTNEEIQEMDIGSLSSGEPPYTQEEALKNIKRASEGESLFFEWNARRKDGQVFWIETNLKRATIGGKDRLLALIRDITERKQAEEALKASEANYREIFNAVTDQIVVQEVDTGRILDANLRTTECLGYTVEELRNMNIEGVSSGEPPYTQEEALENIRRASEGESLYFEWKAKRKDGQIFWIETNLKRATIGGKDRLLALIRDITERKQAEEALKRSEERFSQVADNAVEWIWEVDAKGRYTYASPVVEKILGYLPEEIVGKKHFYDFFSADVRDELKAAAFQAFVECKPFHGFLNLNVRKDGKAVWLLTSGVPILDENGDLLGYRGADSDVTESKQAEEALRLSEQRFRGLTENSTDVIAMFDRDATLLYMNPSAIARFGLEEGDVVGHNAFEFVPSDYGDDMSNAFFTAVDKPGLPIPFFTRARNKYGTTWFLEGYFTSYLDDPALNAVVGNYHDITDRIEAEERLRFANAILRTQQETSPDGILVVDESGKMISYNDRFVEMWGIPGEIMASESDELAIQSVLSKLAHPAAFVAKVEYLYDHRTETSFDELELVGSITYERYSAPMYGPKNEYYGRVWYFHDVTAQKQAEAEIKNSERRLSDIINFLPDATFAVDNQGKLIAWNRACEDMTGVKAKDVMGKGNYEHTVAFYGVRRPLLLDMVLDPLDKIRETYKTLTVEGDTLIVETFSEKLKPDGAYLWSKATPLYGAGGEVVGAIESVRDITDRKLAEEYKREFYRRTIIAATEGKLLMADKGEIERLAGPSIADFTIKTGEDIGTMRRYFSEVARSAGMEESRIEDFAVAMGEATTNALKHANGGKASMHSIPGASFFVVTDSGPGIEAMTIPQVAFVKGYTTAGTLGMGYKIIISVADRIYLATGPQGTTVGIEMKLHQEEEEEEIEDREIEVPSI